MHFRSGYICGGLIDSYGSKFITLLQKPYKIESCGTLKFSCSVIMNLTLRAAQRGFSVYGHYTGDHRTDSLHESLFCLAQESTVSVY